MRDFYASPSTAVLGGSVKLVGSSIFSGGNLQFDKSVNYFDCPDPVSKGIVKHDDIRMGVFLTRGCVVIILILSSPAIDFLWPS